MAQLKPLSTRADINKMSDRSGWKPTRDGTTNGNSPGLPRNYRSCVSVRLAKGLVGIVLLTLDFFLRCANLLAGAKGSPWLRLRAIGAKRPLRSGGRAGKVAKRPAFWRAGWQGGKEARVLAGGVAREARKNPPNQGGHTPWIGGSSASPF